MIQFLIVSLLLVTGLVAQPPTNSTPVGISSITGAVRDGDTGAPLANVMVSTTVQQDAGGKAMDRAKKVSAITDSNGRYQLPNLTAGQYFLEARRRDGSVQPTSRSVMLVGREVLSSIDFRMFGYGVVSGRVTDDNNQPTPGVRVFLLGRELRLGKVWPVIQESTTADDQGQYILRRAVPYRSYRVVAARVQRSMNPISDVPLDIKLRKPVLSHAYYPSSTDIDAAGTIEVQPGGHSDGVNIRMVKSPSYCADGTLENETGPSTFRFSFSRTQISTDIAGFVSPPAGNTGTDGRFRICDLRPGEYRITEWQLSSAGDAAPVFGTTTVNITNRDVHGIKVMAKHFSLSGEVAWDDPHTKADAALTVSAYLEPLGRLALQGERGGVDSGVPGEFALPNLMMDEYSVHVVTNMPQVYVKDITYAGTSVLHEPLRLGSAIGNAGLRIIVARDGGGIRARVWNKDGKPISDKHLIISPASVTSEASYADRLLSGETDQNGNYVSATLHPGKYFVQATDIPFDRAPENVRTLWRDLSKAKAIEVRSGLIADVIFELSQDGQ